MFFQVLFEKTRSMKFAKRLEDRWIFASSGTVDFAKRLFSSFVFGVEKKSKQKEMKEQKGRENAQPVQA